MLNKERKKAVRHGQSRHCSSNMFLWSAGFVLLCLSTLSPGVGACIPCPSSCSCTQVSGTTDECQVDCQSGSFTSIPSQSVLPSGSWKVVKIDLSYNSIQEVTTSSFSGLTNLQEINLRGNTIYYTEGQSFDSLTSLQTLDLSSNPITELPNNMFDPSNNIQNLNISNLQLKSLKVNTIKDLKEIISLDVSYNNITSLENDIFDKCKKLETLNISNNQLVTLEFKRNKRRSISSIDISNNYLSSLEVNHLSSVSGTLTDLNLSGNSFTSLDTSVISQLTSLQSLDLSNNPWNCVCSLKTLYDKLVELETAGLTLVNKASVTCSNMAGVSLFDLTSNVTWFGVRTYKVLILADDNISYRNGILAHCNTVTKRESTVQCLLPTCPDSYGSCYEDLELQTKTPILFSSSSSTTAVLDCSEACFDANTTHAAITTGSSSACLCGNVLQNYGDCYCNTKSYSAGENMQCVPSSGSTITKTYVESAFEVLSGLKFDPISTIIAGQTFNVKASVTLRTITQYIWNFGDSSTSQTKTTTSMSYTMSYTYAVPGTYTITLGIASNANGYASGSLTVDVLPNSALISVSVISPSSTDYETGAVSGTAISAEFTMAHKLEYYWSRSPDDNITSPSGGGCSTGQTEYHGRCLKLESAQAQAAGVTTCLPGSLLTLHFAQELTDVIATFSASVTSNAIYLDAKKSGSTYVWTTGTKAYFTTSDVSNSGAGDCVYISVSDSTLRGSDCTNSYDIICQHEPVSCPHGGSLYPSNNQCYTLLTSSLSWTSASSTCTNLDSSAHLMTIDTDDIKTFILTNVLSSGKAWTGLTDRSLEGQLTWADGAIWSSYPVVNSTVVDCFNMDSTGTWLAESCQTSLPALCQYPSREEASVPVYLTGTGELKSTSFTLTSIASSTAPASYRNAIRLFPGMWVNRSGKVRGWNFRLSAGRAEGSIIAFQVYQPQCPAYTVLKTPGCNGNGGKYSSCPSTSSCTKSTASCPSNQEYCPITDSCLPKLDPCNCNGRTDAFCSNDFVGDIPTYVLRGQTYVVVPSGGEVEMTVQADGFTVEENDVLAFSTNSTSDVIKCDISSSSTWRQSYTAIPKLNWISVQDSIVAGTFTHDYVCYFQMIYTPIQTEEVPSTMRYFTEPDDYTFSLTVPSVSATSSATIKAEESVGDITWISPQVQVVGGSSSTIFVEDNVSTYLTFSVKQGTQLSAKWTVGISDQTKSFESTCPASISAAFPTECNTDLTRRPLAFSYIQHTFLYSSGSSQTVSIKVTNDLAMEKTINITVLVKLPLAGLNLYMQTPTTDNVVEIGSPTTFITNITTGTPTSYELSLNGTSVSNTSTSPITYTFTTKGTFSFAVTASDGLTSTSADIIVRPKYKAAITGLTFSSLDNFIAATISFTFQVTATAVAGAEITNTWHFGPTSLTSSHVISSTSLTISEVYTYASAGNYTIIFTAIDEFGVNATISKDIQVLDPITTLTLFSGNVYLEIGGSVTFQAKMDDPTVTYGNIIYSFDYADGDQDINVTDSSKSHTYTSPGEYNVTVTATNGASKQTAFLILYVQQKISGLTLSGDNFVVVNSSQTYTVSVTEGTSLQNKYDITSLGFSTGFVSSMTLTYIFTSEGVYNISLLTRNELNFQRTYMEVTVVSGDTLFIKTLTHTRNVVVNSAVAMEISVIHHDSAGLTVTWYYGDGNTEKGVGKFTASHTYNTAGDYNITVFIQDTTQTPVLETQNSSMITVMRNVVGLILSNNGPGTINSSMGVNITMTATLTDGTNLNYIWTVSGTTYDTQSTNYITLEFTTTGSHSVAVNVSNAISSLTSTSIFVIQSMIEDLAVACTTCVTDVNGNHFVEAGVSTTYTVSYSGGSDLNFEFHFNDGSGVVSQSAVSTTHTYSAGNYSVLIIATNLVDNKTVELPIAVQSRIVGVSFPPTMTTLKLINQTFSHELIVSGGTDVKYIWKFCDACVEIYSDSNTITNPGYSIAGKYYLNGTAYNVINAKSVTKQLIALDTITSITLTSTLVRETYAKSNTQYNFYSMADVNLPSGTTIYNYQIAKSTDPYPTSTVSQNFTYTFTTTEQYKIKVEATNFLTSRSTEIFVTVQDEITSPSISSNGSADITFGSAVKLTVSTVTGTDRQYQWTVEENGVTQALSSTTNVLEYLFSNKGNFTFSVNVSNEVSWKSDTYEQKVMDAVENISISTDIGSTSPYVSEDVPVTFTSVVGKGDYYSVLWNIADNSGNLIHSLTDVNLIYTFTTSGTYTVKMSVSSAVSSLSVSMIVYVQVPVVSLSLVPSSTTTRTTDTVSFTAVHNSNATHLTYHWTFEGVTTQTSTTGNSHLFSTPGTYTVLLTVQNNISNMSTQIDIIAQDVIQGLAIYGCDSEAVEDTHVSVITNITSGTDVSFLWEPLIGASQTGNNFSTVFATTGIYSIKLNASNLVDSQVLSCTMTIIGVISGLAIDTSSSVHFVNYSMIFAVHGNNLVGVSYNWTFTGPATVNQITSSNLLTHKFAVDGTYSGILVVTNTISEASVSVTFTIEALTCDAPVVTAIGASTRTIYKTSPVSFELDINTNGCMDYVMKYLWSVYSSSSCTPSSLVTHLTLPSNVYNSSAKFTIPSKTLAYGSYCVKADAEYTGTPLKETLYYTVTVVESQLVALLAGGSSRKVSSLSPVVIDGTSSYDPDDASTPLTYSWSCSITSGTSSPSGCSDITSSSNSSVTMATSNLVAGQTYQVTLTVSSPGRSAGTATELIEISGDNIPIVSLTCLSCVANGIFVINPGAFVMLEGSCSNCASASSVTYTWTAEHDGTAFTLDSTSTATGNNKNNLVINANQLPAATSFSFTLQVQKVENSVTTTGFAKVTYSGNSAPSGGSCSISSSAVVSLETPVTFTCTGYSDPGSSSTELYYSVWSFSSDLSESVILYHGSSAQANFYAAPWPGVSRTSMKVKIFVEDGNGASTEALDSALTITSPSLSSTTQVEYIHSLAYSTLSNLVLENNPSLILQFCIAMVHELNEQSRQAAALATSDTTLAMRTLVRNAISVAAIGLPLETIQEQEQAAFILNHVTKYAKEYQTRECQSMALNEVEVIKSLMRTSQGVSENVVLTEHLMACVSNLMVCANAGFYDADSVANSTTNLDTSLVTSFKSTLSTSDTSASTLTAEDHRKVVVQKAFTKSEDIVTVNLKNQVYGQAPIEMTLDGITFKGERVLAGAVSTVYQSGGVAVEVQADMLDGIVTPSTKEVLQMMIGIPQNPFTWGYAASAINSKVLTMSFKETSGTDITIQNLEASKEIKFFLPDDSTNGYSNIDTGGLVTNSQYDPSAGITFSAYELEKSSKKKIEIDTTGTSTGHAMHIQLKVAVIPDASITESPLENVKFFLGKGYEATASSYEETLTVETSHSASGVNHDNYTIFIDSTSFDPSASYTITVHNDDTNFAYNISAAIYFSSCGYYDESAGSWSLTGCYPLSESLPQYAVCKCNHLTAFGGAMLVPPSAISFTDLVNLDLSSNPVVFIAVCIIFVVYVVAVIVCRKMDLMDLERIATVPLCGKDGSFKYHITVVTGRDRGAGTTAHVGIKLYGDYGKSQSRQLSKEGAFQRNCIDSFFIAHETNLGNINKIRIWHDNYGLDPSWHFIQVIIRDMQNEKKYYFFGNCWLTLERERGFIQKEITAAGSSEIKRFSRMFGHALSNSMADRHLWVSIVDRPALSRFTRVQRATLCVTLLYVFMGVNAVWYGILKTKDSSSGLSSFGWEEVILAFICNIMVFPISLFLIFFFKKSRSKSTVFEHRRAQTAQTIEIANDCDQSQYSTSFRSDSQSDLHSCLARESTTDSIMVANQPHQPLRRSKTLKTNRKGAENTSVKVPLPDTAEAIPEKANMKWKRTNNPRIWNQEAILDSWPDHIPRYTERIATPKTSHSHQNKQEEVKEAAEDILNYLDNVEASAMATESAALQKNRAALGGGGAKPLTRKPTRAQKGSWEDVDNLPEMDYKTKSRTPNRRTSITSIANKPPSSQSNKGFNPRQDPNIRKPPSAGSNKVSKWVSKLHTTVSGLSSLPDVEHTGPLQPDLGLAQQTNSDFYPDDYEDMELVTDAHKQSCRLPAWCVYVAYFLCFVLSSTCIILVILYGRLFGSSIALQWLLALLFSFVFSFLFMEPVKAIIIALYLAAVEKKTEDTDDVIDIEPKFDTSNELVKEVKFKPLKGFALLNAKEDGMKIQRMRLMLRQFVAYMFYLCLVLVLCYINFSYHTFVFSNAVEDVFIRENMPDTNISYQNMSSIEEVWTWSQSVLIDGIHYDELTTITEFNILLGVARLRQVRGLRESCPIENYPLHSGLGNLLGSTSCEGSLGYNEDKNHYGYWWNISQSQNLSWRYHSDSQTDSKRRQGHLYSYGGGGYVQYLGSTYNESLNILQDLQSRDWIDLRTRALFVDFTLYSAAEDLTTFVTLMIEFPLSGGVNTTYDIQTNKLLRFQEDVVDPLMVCEVILFVVVLYYLIHSIYQIREQGCKYLYDPWNWFEFITTLLAVVAIGLYMGCVITATDKFKDFLSNTTAFTNFESVSDVHTGTRYLHAWLVFLLMFKVVRQIRFIKFLHKYEKTLSYAGPKLMGVFLIFMVLYLTHGMLSYLFLGRHADGFQNYMTTLMTQLGMVKGTYNFFPLLQSDEIFAHFFFYSYYIFVYGLTVGLVMAILNDSYKSVKSQMYYKATLDLQDYEMIEFMMKRFKLWAGFDKPKSKTRRVHFEGQRSISDRCSTSHSNRSLDSDLDPKPSQQPPPPPVLTKMSAAAQLSAKWEDVLKTMARVEYLDSREEDMIAKTQRDVEEWGFNSRLKSYESERQGLLQWKEPSTGTARSSSTTKVPHRTMTQKSLPGKSDVTSLQPSSSAGGTKPPAPKGKRPASDGGRITTDKEVQEPRISSRERLSIYNFFKSIKPSKSAWNS